MLAAKVTLVTLFLGDMDSAKSLLGYEGSH